MEVAFKTDSTFERYESGRFGALKSDWVVDGDGSR